MRSSSYTIVNLVPRPNGLLALGSLLLLLCAFAAAQSVAVVAPNNNAVDNRIAAEIIASMVGSAQVQDMDMSRAAFDSAKHTDPFNMTTEDARQLGRVVGCDFLILVKSGRQRRVALGKPDYVEAYAALFTISSRTGRLVDWRILSENAPDADGAVARLSKVVQPTTLEILRKLRSAAADEAAEAPLARLEEPPDPTSPAAKEFRAPVPYQRLKPQYTETAYLYDVTATVEMTIDLNAGGQITRSEITRWAGYGLDESVRAAVTSMNWRPAERSGRPIPMRVLLRYNFKKLEK